MGPASCACEGAANAENRITITASKDTARFIIILLLVKDLLSWFPCWQNSHPLQGRIL
jgi:hypothetical protein